MHSENIDSLYSKSKETSLFGRYIHNDLIEPLLNKPPLKSSVNNLGRSVNGESIYSITIGQGPKKILIWSQMHGNESTTTKAVFDLLNAFHSKNDDLNGILNSCTIKIIPILNPDGARAYNRLNANGIDLNRDAQDLTQPESKILRQVFNEFKPDLCFNLHGQRTIFGAGDTGNPASVSFLAPAQDEDRSLTVSRKKAMDCIVKINTNLQKRIPNRIGRYDDSFNLNCVGDTFQSLNVPTVLFEAGHYPGDYEREEVRKLIFEALYISIDYFASNELRVDNYDPYFKIPENQKNFFDLIIRNTSAEDIAIQYEEKLNDNYIQFVPKIEKISNLSSYYGHKEINANKHEVFNDKSLRLEVGHEIDFVLINNEKFSLKLKKN